MREPWQPPAPVSSQPPRRSRSSSSEAGAHTDQVAGLDRARRADGVRPLARLVDARLHACEEAQEQARASLETAAGESLGSTTSRASSSSATDELAVRTALLPAEQRLSERRDSEAAAAALLASLTTDDELASAETEAVAALVRDLTVGGRAVRGGGTGPPGGRGRSRRPAVQRDGPRPTSPA